MGGGWLGVGVVVWGLILALGMGRLAHYEARAGTDQQPEVDAVKDVAAALGIEGRALVCVVHPRCPCTSATLAELARVVGASGVDAEEVHILALAPSDSDPEWEGLRLERLARKLGFRWIPDPGGALQRRLGAETSGLVLLLDQGRQLFRGGVTPGRGHEGDNAGRRRLLRALRTHETVQGHAVYGCELKERT